MASSRSDDNTQENSLAKMIPGWVFAVSAILGLLASALYWYRKGLE